MKKLLIVLGFVAGSAVAVNAQDSTSVNQAAGSTTVQTDAQDDKQQIAVAELPAIVQDQLKSADYSAWTVGNAYKKEKEGQTFYAVELTSGSETKVVKFDAQGNKVDEKSKDKK